MSKEIRGVTESFIFNASEWSFADLRIDIPANSYGSDAINPHTQYSNPLAFLKTPDHNALGSSFTLGEGNQMVCEAAEFLINQLEGTSLAELLLSDRGFHDIISNPLQLRWISPNAGIPMLAGGLIINTLLDHMAKICEIPAWEFLSKMPTDLLLAFFPKRHLPPKYSQRLFKEILDKGLDDIENRCQYLKVHGLPTYFTTWIGHTADAISSQIISQYHKNGIKMFKLKISPNFREDFEKINMIKSTIPQDAVLCVDANQTLSLEQAKTWMAALSNIDAKWLEEPFAPDNTALFRELSYARKKEQWSTEIATGENCPNHYTAAELMNSGVTRFQPDPCRMLGLIDAIYVSCIAKIERCPITPHAGGSSLDELSPHIQLFNLARICPKMDIEKSLTENVGFCSHYFAAPTRVSNGKLASPLAPGLLGGLDKKVSKKIKNYQEGISWLEHSF